MFGTFTQMHDRYLEVPDDEVVWGYDWQGQEIYVGEEYRNIEGKIVLEEEFQWLPEWARMFFEADYPVMIAGE